MNKNAKKVLLIILFVLLFAGVAGVVLYTAQNNKKVTVYDWSRTIVYDEKSNYKISDADLTETSFLAADVREDYITDKNEAIGMYLTCTVNKGTTAVTSQLSKDPTYIDKGGISELAEYRKFYLKVDMNGSFAGDIKSGDLVDLLYTESSSGFSAYRTEEVATEGSGLNYTQSRLIMQSVPVYQVYTANGSVYKKKVTDPETLGKYAESSTSKDKEENFVAPSYVALTVTVPQYEELSARMHFGTISLVSRFDGSADVESNGHIIIKGTNAGAYVGEGNLDYNIGLDGEITGLVESGAEKPSVPAEAAQPAEIPTVTNGQIPELYSFIKTLAKFSMTDTQRDQYNSVYTRYSEYMEEYGGTEWELNKPEEVTMEMLQANIDSSDTAKMKSFLAWRTDLETLAKEMRGASVILPW